VFHLPSLPLPAERRLRIQLSSVWVILSSSDGTHLVDKGCLAEAFTAVDCRQGIPAHVSFIQYGEIEITFPAHGMSAAVAASSSTVQLRAASLLFFGFAASSRHRNLLRQTTNVCLGWQPLPQRLWLRLDRARLAIGPVHLQA
jgi:hypothetical protein